MSNHRADRRGPSRALSADSAPRSPGGRRKAVKSTPSHGLVRILPSAPVVAGVAALAVSATGAVALENAAPADQNTREMALSAASAQAVSGSGSASSDDLRAERSADQVASRDFNRKEAQAEADATAKAEAQVTAQAEQQAKERTQAIAAMGEQAEQQAEKIQANQWELPFTGYRITNTFGMAKSYYASGAHTGLDFAAPQGTEIGAVAGGTVTSTSYEGSYGNRTIITLEDGTEMWYCHQLSFNVSVGDTVRTGDAIGLVGSTGNSTGPHLHLEVRPGGGDPIDPAAALQEQGITP